MEDQQKILCLIDGLGSGGAQRQLVGLSKLLKDKGYNVLFVWYHETEFYKYYLEDNHIPFIQLHARNKLTKFYKVFRTVKDFQPNCIITYLGGPNKISCAMKMLGLKAKVIVSERNLTQKINFYQRLKFFLFRWADIVVSNSFAQTDFINSHFKQLREKTRTIRNFVDADFFCPLPKKEDDKTLTILVAGRISIQKNLLRFMRAIKMVQDNNIPFNVKWFGRVSAGQNDYYDKVKQLYKKLNIQESLEFHDATPDILKEYHNCDVFCLPSLYEGFPNVICEAMSCGKPILCSDVADNSYLVKDGINGYLFDPLSVEDMANKLMKLIELPNKEREQMGERNRIFVLENLSEDIFIENYIQIING